MKSKTKHLITFVTASALSLNLFYVIENQSGVNKYPLFKKEVSLFDNNYVFVGDENVSSTESSSLVNSTTSDGSLTLNNLVASKLHKSDLEIELINGGGVDLETPVNSESIPMGNVEISPSVEPIVPVEIVKPEKIIKEYTVGSGDSLIRLLKKSGLSSLEVKGIVYNSGVPKTAFSLKKGDVIEVHFDENGAFEGLHILPNGANFYIVSFSDGSFSHKKDSYPEEKREIKKSFIISESVYKDGLDIGLTASEVAKVIDVFQHKVNTSKVSKGEEFDVVMDRVFINQKFTGKSFVKAVRHTKRGDSKYAFLWSEGDKQGYFDENGDGLMPSFIRHPIKNPRITSNYNPKRMHPILKIVRPHRGTDYGGNRKPIMAIGDGVVVYSGRKGSFGNTVIIKHANGVQTLSAHMSKIMNVAKKGSKVKKGDTIGLVGSTGISTGPHLHFEMKIDGKYVNSLKAPLPMDDKVGDIKSYKPFVEKLMKREGWL